ncbi:MAG: hypothetical protein ACT4TC_26440, partial [Myxococcaceae bacterium]
MNNEKEKDEGPVRSAELEHRAPSRLDAWVTALKSDAHRVRTSPLQPPPVDRRFARFLWGLLLPFSLLRIGTNAPGAKETFVRTGALTGAITLTAALLLVLSPVTRSWFEKGSDRDAGALVEDEDEAPLPRTGRKNALSRALRQLRSEVGKLSQRSAARERGAIRSALSEVVDSSEELLEEDRTPRVKDKEWERTLKTDMRKALGELADAGVELDAQLMIDGGESGSTVHALTSAIDDDDGDDERGELASLRDDTAELREALHLPATEAQ